MNVCFQEDTNPSCLDIEYMLRDFCEISSVGWDLYFSKLTGGYNIYIYPCHAGTTDHIDFEDGVKAHISIYYNEVAGSLISFFHSKYDIEEGELLYHRRKDYSSVEAALHDAAIFVLGNLNYES
jgi:hypothetical protein